MPVSENTEAPAKAVAARKEQAIKVIGICAALFAINALIAHKLFALEYSWFSFSIEGTFIALARAIVEHGPRFTWLPFWNLGIPATHSYPPLLPRMTAMFSRAAQVSPSRAYHLVTAFWYCVAPVTFFVFVRKLSEHTGRALFAALAWTVLSPSTLLIAPIRTEAEAAFTFQRLRAMVIYGAGPEILGLALLPVALLLFHLFMSRGRARMAVLTAVVVGAIAITNAVAFVAVAGALVILALVHGRRGLWIVPILGSACLLICRWIPPSLLAAARANSLTTENADYRWNDSTVGGAAVVLLLFALVWSWSRDWQDRALRFAVLWSALLFPAVLLSASYGIHVVPQAFRYHLAMEMPLCLAAVLALAKLPARVRNALAYGFLAASAILTIHGYRFATRLIQEIDPRTDTDYRVAAEFTKRFPHERVLAMGGVSFVLNVESDTPQFYGGHEQYNPNRVNRIALYQFHTGDGAGARDGDICVLWMKAFGVHAVNVAGAANVANDEHHKPFARNPAIFEGLLPVETRVGGDTIYRVPERVAGLAHVVPETSLVANRPRDGLDIEGVKRYVAALDDASLPAANYSEINLEKAQIRARVAPGQVVSVQTNYHRGWHASIDGQPQRTSSDGLGLLVIHAQCTGECVIDLTFDGGLELLITRVLGGITVLALATVCFLPARSLI